MKQLILRLLIVVVCTVGSFYAGYMARKPEVRTETKIQEVEKVVTIRVKDTTTKPDGTIIVREEEKTTKDSKSNTKEKAKRPSAVAASKPTWSLQLDFRPVLVPVEMKPAGLEIGRRVLGDVWATAGYNWDANVFTIGVRYEW